MGALARAGFDRGTVYFTGAPRAAFRFAANKLMEAFWIAGRNEAPSHRLNHQHPMKGTTVADNFKRVEHQVAKGSRLIL